MNAWLQVDQIATEALMILEDSLVITNLTARDKTADFNKTAAGYSVGDTVRIKTRPDYEAKEFVNTVEVQAIRESGRAMTIEKHFDISVEITAKEKALDLESYIDQVVRPAVYRLAEKCDRYVGTKILDAAGLYASTDLLGTSADLALARQAGNWQQLEPGGRFILMNEDLEAKLLGKDYFTKYDNRGEDGVVSFREAALGKAMGFQFYSSLQFPEQTHTAGTGVGVTNSTTTLNVIGVKTLTIDAADFTLTPINAGDRLYIAGVRRPLIAGASVAGPGVTAIPLVDPISEIIPDGAAVTVIAAGLTYDVQGVLFDSQSMAVAMPLLDKPSDKPSFIVNSNGYSIRVVTGYDMTTKKEMMSLDTLIGAAAYDPRRMTLLADAA